MPLSFKVVFRLIGILNIALSTLGTYWMVKTIVSVFLRHQWNARTPYFTEVFIVMTVINIIFLVALIVTAVWLIRLDARSVRIYCIVAGLMILYVVLSSGLWLAPDPIGASIASAGGVGDMGLSPFMFTTLPLLPVPFVYPVLSAAFLFFIRKRVMQMTISRLTSV